MLATELVYYIFAAYFTATVSMYLWYNTSYVPFVKYGMVVSDGNVGMSTSGSCTRHNGNCYDA